MNHLELKYNYGFSWSGSQSVRAKGFLHAADGRYYSSGSVHEYFSGIKSFEELEERVVNANGLFCVIVNLHDCVLLASDRIRMFPLFYCKKDDFWSVSDDSIHLAGLNGYSQLDETAVASFLASGYVCGSRTLISGVSQVQAGEIVCLRKKEISTKFYYRYTTGAAAATDKTVIKSTSTGIFESAFKRMMESLEGKTAVLALSGGYDSRLIAAMLKKMKHPNVVCYTYGRKGNAEAEISAKVAAKLEFPWFNIEYNNELIDGFLESPTFRDYYQYSANGTSMFFMQEFFAVQQLKERGLVPSDSVFIAGHSGDFLGGSQLMKYGIGINETIDSIAAKIMHQKFHMKPVSGIIKKKLLGEIVNFLGSAPSALPYSVYEDWDMKEKLSKFTANSVNVYGFFGYEFRLPFWDTELTDFFRDLYYENKAGKELYDEILINNYFKPANLIFEHKLHVTLNAIKKQKIKEKLRPFLPTSIRHKRMVRNDNIFYHEITGKMLNYLKQHGKRSNIYGNTYNSIIVQWYAYQISQQLYHPEEEQI